MKGVTRREETGHTGSEEEEENEFDLTICWNKDLVGDGVICGCMLL